jgi:hypothetical protein
MTAEIFGKAGACVFVLFRTWILWKLGDLWRYLMDLPLGMSVIESWHNLFRVLLCCMLKLLQCFEVHCSRHVMIHPQGGGYIICRNTGTIKTTSFTPPSVIKLHFLFAHAFTCFGFLVNWNNFNIWSAQWGNGFLEPDMCLNIGYKVHGIMNA